MELRKPREQFIEHDHSENPELQRSFRGHKSKILSVAFNPTLKNMSSTSKTGEVRLWHFKSDMRPFKFTKHIGPVHCCDYSPCGKYLATGGQDNKVFIWKNVAEGDKFHIKFTAHAGPVKSVKFSKDGNFLVTGGDDKMAKLWKISKNYKKSTFLRTFKGHTNWVMKTDISPDSTIVASICDKTIRIWDASTGNQFLRYMNVVNGNRCLEFHPDGNYIGISGSSGIIQIWDTRANKLAQIYETNEPVNEITFHPSGQFLAAAFDYIESKNNSVLKIFDIRQGRCIYKISGVYGSLYGLRFSIDGEYLASGGEEKLVYVWKSNFKPLKPLDRENESELEEIEKEIHQKKESEIYIGGALSLHQNSIAKENEKKTRAYEKLTMTLENLVSSVNSISLNMKEMCTRMDKNQQRAKDLFKVIGFKEMINGKKSPDFDSRGYLTEIDSGVISFDGKNGKFDSMGSSKGQTTNLYNYSDSINFSQVNPVTVQSRDIVKSSLTQSEVTSMSNPFRKGNLAGKIDPNINITTSFTYKSRFENLDQSNRFNDAMGTIVSNIEKQRLKDDQAFDQNKKVNPDFIISKSESQEEDHNEIPGNYFESEIQENDNEELRDTIEKPLKKSEEDDKSRERPKCFKTTEFLHGNGDRESSTVEISYQDFINFVNANDPDIEVDFDNFTVKVTIQVERYREKYFKVRVNIYNSDEFEEEEREEISHEDFKRLIEIPSNEVDEIEKNLVREMIYLNEIPQEEFERGEAEEKIDEENYVGGVLDDEEEVPEFYKITNLIHENGEIEEGDPEIISEEEFNNILKGDHEGNVHIDRNENTIIITIDNSNTQEEEIEPLGYHVKYESNNTGGLGWIQNVKISEEEFLNYKPESGNIPHRYSKEGNLLIIESKKKKRNYESSLEGKELYLIKLIMQKNGEKKILEEKKISLEEYLNFENNFVPQYEEFLIKRQGNKLYVIEYNGPKKSEFEFMEADDDYYSGKKKLYHVGWTHQEARALSEEEEERSNGEDTL